MTSTAADPAGGARFELTTVADDEVVLHWRSEGGAGVEAHRDLAADAEVTFRGITARTLPRPPGELLCRFATVNDVHFGERECGRVGDVHRIAAHYLGFLGDIAVGAGAEGAAEATGAAKRVEAFLERLGGTPVLTTPDGETPYPELMSRSAAVEIDAIEAAVVIAKGDLTAAGTSEEHAAFLECYKTVFGDRLVEVRGNHDVMSGERFAADSCREIVLDGAILAVLDTSIEGQDTGTVLPEQLEWLDELGARADRPVLVFGHHHAADPDTELANVSFFGIDPESSKALVEVVARRTRILAYFAGHTHRNRVRRFSGSGDVPYVEVAAAKDFPGSWAEYRVYEGGVLQVHRRTSADEALAWSERCRALYWGMYARYSFGSLADRCFPIWPR